MGRQVWGGEDDCPYERGPKKGDFSLRKLCPSAMLERRQTLLFDLLRLRFRQRIEVFSHPIIPER